MVELLSLRSPNTTSRLSTIPDQPDRVPWGITLQATFAAPPPPDLQCWGVGSDCGGLAYLQPVPHPDQPNTVLWTIGSGPDILPCHVYRITQCWLINPHQFRHPPANFGKHTTRSTPRREIDRVIPFFSRIAQVVSAPPSLFRSQVTGDNPDTTQAVFPPAQTSQPTQPTQPTQFLPDYPNSEPNP